MAMNAENLMLDFADQRLADRCRVLLLDSQPFRLEVWTELLDPALFDWQLIDPMEEGLPGSLERYDAVVISGRIESCKLPEWVSQIRTGAGEAIRILAVDELSEPTDLAMLESVHQIVNLDARDDRLGTAVIRAISFRDLLNRHRTRAAVSCLDALPSIPRVYHDFINAASSEAVDYAVLAEIIEQDVALTARILQIVNSAYFAFPTDVSSIKHAISVVGMEMLSALVTATTLFRALDRPEYSSFLERLWVHGRTVSALAMRLGRLNHPMSRDQAAELAKTGLLHDIGYLVILRYMPDFIGIIDENDSTNPLKRCALERSLIGASHAELGAYLLSLWSIGEDTARATAIHHSIEKVAASECPIAESIFVADAFLEEPPARSVEELAQRAAELQLERWFGKEKTQRWVFEAACYFSD